MQVNFLWTEDIKTAQTNGVSLYWNPHWLLKLPFDTRVTVLLHELWHIALLHMLRRGTVTRKSGIMLVIFALIICSNRRDTPSKASALDDAAYGTQSAEEVYDGLYQMPNPSIYGEFVWGP